MRNLKDNEIIESVNKGNTEDFSLLVDRYKNKAFNLLKGILKTEMDAEEVLMDSFMKAYRGLKTFRNDSSFSTWFYRIVYNNALSFIGTKKYKIEKEMTAVEDHFDLAEEDDKIYAESENASEYLLKIVDRLPVKNALVIILFYIDELSLNEIANIMDLSLVNVKVILHRSRNLLKDMIIKRRLTEELL